MQKEGDCPRKHEVLRVDLPLACLDTRRIGVRASENTVGAAGRAFCPAGGKLNVDLRLNGENGGPCVTGTARPDEGEVLATESPPVSGFRKVVLVQEPRKRPHVIWVAEPTKPVSLCATCFVKGRVFRKIRILLPGTQSALFTGRGAGWLMPSLRLHSPAPSERRLSAGLYSGSGAQRRS